MSFALMASAEADVPAPGDVQRKSGGPKAATRRGGPVGRLSHAELLVLGCGPAGYSAAVHAARANLRPLLVTGVARDEASTVGAAPNGWPTDVDMVQGLDLKRRLRDHAERASTRVAFDPVNWVNLARRPFHVQGDSGHYTCDALIIAVDQPLAAALFQGQLEMKDGHIVTFTGLSGMATLTSLQGVFVVGDALDPALGHVITSTGTACMAVLDAQRFLKH